jgi:hypothetical protein
MKLLFVKLQILNFDFSVMIQNLDAAMAAAFLLKSGAMEWLTVMKNLMK